MTTGPTGPLGADVASQILATVPDPVLVLSMDGSILLATDAMRGLLGLDPQRVQGRRLAELVGPDDAERLRAWFEECVGAGGARVEVRMPHAAGGQPTVELHGRASRAADCPGAIVATLRDVSEPAEALAALRASELRYRQFFDDDVTGDYVATPDGRLLACNAAFAAILGYDSVDEVLRVPTPALYADPASRERLLDRLRRERAVRRIEVQLQRKDGRTVHVIATVIGGFDEHGELVSFRGYLFDVTAQRRLADERSELLRRERAARALAEAAERRTAFLAEVGSTLGSSLDYRQTLVRLARFVIPTLGDYCLIDEATPEGGSRRVAFAHVDADAERLLTADSSTAPDADPGKHPLLRVLQTGQPIRAADVSEEELDRIAHDAAHREALRRMGICSYLIVPLRARNRILGTMTLVSSVSGRKFAEPDLELAQAVADRAALAVDNARLFSGAQQAARAREEVLAFVSHDLRNPLATILLNASALIETIPAERLLGEEREQLEWIARSSEQMNEMIQGLLDVARIESGRMPIRALPTLLEPVLAEAVAAMRPLAQEREVDLDLDRDETATRALVDREKLFRVLSNLIGNAIKFTPPGGSVRVWREPREPMLVVAVADTGIGIPTDDAPHLFEAYWQGPAHRAAGGRGSGLGLTIAKGIVEAHGGSIWFETSPAGTTFCFSVPLVEAAED